jgi:NADH dehydrogenase FAD-containing subunit
MTATRTLVVPKPEKTHVVVVGGGAGGLELVTTLGNKLGKRGRRRSRWWISRARTSGSRCCTK